MEIDEIIQKNIKLLAKHSVKEDSLVPGSHAPLPSIESIKKIISLVKNIILTDYFYKRQPEEEIRSYYIGIHMEQLYQELKEQIARGLLFNSDLDEGATPAKAKVLAAEFIDRLPYIKHLLYTDVEAMFVGDPAATNYGEVIYCYPVVNAMTHYRCAHELHLMGIPVLPRIITDLAHS